MNKNKDTSGLANNAVTGHNKSSAAIGKMASITLTSSGYKSISEPKKISSNIDSRAELVELKKEVGIWNGVGIIAGTVIGSGIFVSPGSVVKYTGSIGMSLIVWLLTGIMAMCGALCFAEMGTMIPKSGGEYTYILEAFGPIPAFLDLWATLFIAGPAARAIGLLTFATYTLQPFLQECETVPYWAVRLVALALLWIVGYINYVGVKMGAGLQSVFTLLKLLALIVIVIFGMLHLARGNVENLLNPMEGTVTSPFSIATAFYSTTYAYAGWDTLNNMTEEIENPNK
ncbi:Y+L amino acid transporter 2 [Halocaridina rubra]|uniref:Y+L amino acid transporter 2 n=1 Tax=Halocaridina rubra TaxID=373956 RepID=A0AAN8X4J7_HALRR